MGINSWFSYGRNELRELINSVLDDVLHWRIAVVYGPTSAEDRLYMSSKPRSEWSINDVLSGLSELGVDAVWLEPTQPDFAERVREFDAAFINAHGSFGEDGDLQGLLAYLGVPYTGSGVASSAIAADKRLTKLVLAHSGVPVPTYRRVSSSHPADLSTIGAPVMLKAVDGGSSVGMELVNDLNDLGNVLKRFHLEGFSDIIAETFVDGLAVTVPSIRIRNEIVLLPPVVCVTDREFYDEHSKLRGDRDGSVQYHTLTDPTDVRLHRLHDAVRKVLEIIDFEGAVRVDFILGHNDQPILLEINSIPGVQHGSNLVLSATSIDIDYPSLLGIILASAANMKKIATWKQKKIVHRQVVTK